MRAERMYRISKVLNHNTIIGIQEEDHQEYLIMGKGIGFGKKVTERVELPDEVSMYSLKETTRRGSASKLARSIPPEYLEVADLVLQEAERVFGKIDQSVLFPMADHIEYAVKRIQSGEAISNPLTEDIRLLFYSEYKVALTVVPKWVLIWMSMKWGILRFMSIRRSKKKNYPRQCRLRRRSETVCLMWKMC